MGIVNLVLPFSIHANNFHLAFTIPSLSLSLSLSSEFHAIFIFSWSIRACRKERHILEEISFRRGDDTFLMLSISLDIIIIVARAGSKVTPLGRNNSLGRMLFFTSSTSFIWIPSTCLSPSIVRCSLFQLCKSSLHASLPPLSLFPPLFSFPSLYHPSLSSLSLLLSAPFGWPTVLLQQRTASSRRYTYTSLTFALSFLPWPHPHNRRVIIKAARYTWTPFAPFHNIYIYSSIRRLTACSLISGEVGRSCKEESSRKCCYEYLAKLRDRIFRPIIVIFALNWDSANYVVAVKCDSMYRLKVAPRRYATLMASRANSFRGE